MDNSNHGWTVARKKLLDHSKSLRAEKGTWTLMVLLPHGPEPCASANSAISAWQVLLYPMHFSLSTQIYKIFQTFATVHSYILVGDFLSRMKIYLQECTKRAPRNEQKWAAKQRRTSQMWFCEWRVWTVGITITFSRFSDHSLPALLLSSVCIPER